MRLIAERLGWCTAATAVVLSFVVRLNKQCPCVIQYIDLIGPLDPSGSRADRRRLGGCRVLSSPVTYIVIPYLT